MQAQQQQQQQDVILACDADAFFVQVEVLRDPSLQGKPVAVQQHQDIIAANAAAKSAGVRKHMVPHEARAILGRVGGQVVHVHLEDGFRVSYRPYREVSAALNRLLKGFAGAAVVERASIDEAFILMHASDAPLGDRLRQGEHMAQQMRQSVKQELGITISVGISSNKLLAKLACRAAKPDGVRTVMPGTPAMSRLLDKTPIDRLPGMGGQVAALLAGLGVRDCAGLNALLAAAPDTLLQAGLPPARATLLTAYAQGRDTSRVVDKGPPQSFQVQMTLTPVPIPARGHGTSGPMLQPLPVQGPDTTARLSSLLLHMCRDLVARVVLDRHQEGRWPRKLGISLHCQHPAAPSASGSGGVGPGQAGGAQHTSRRTPFPSAALLDAAQEPPATVSGAEASRYPTSGGGGSGPSRLLQSERMFVDGPGSSGADTGATTAVLAAVHGVALGMAQAVLQQQHPTWVITQVALSASEMVPLEKASAPVITRFLVPPSASGAGPAAVSGQNPVGTSRPAHTAVSSFPVPKRPRQAALMLEALPSRGPAESWRVQEQAASAGVTPIRVSEALQALGSCTPGEVQALVDGLKQRSGCLLLHP